MLSRGLAPSRFHPDLLPIDMHKTWPRLLKRIKSGKYSSDSDERELVISTRTWLCLYVFEHQYVPIILFLGFGDGSLAQRVCVIIRLALGTGRPMILHDDESIRECRLFLQHRKSYSMHPLSTQLTPFNSYGDQR